MTIYPPKTINLWQKMKDFIYKGVRVLGISSLVGSYIIFMWTFLTAYSNPTKSVLVTINKYGEAQAEYIFLWFLLLPTIYIIGRLLKREAQHEAL